MVNPNKLGYLSLVTVHSHSVDRSCHPRLWEYWFDGIPYTRATRVRFFVPHFGFYPSRKYQSEYSLIPCTMCSTTVEQSLQSRGPCHASSVWWNHTFRIWSHKDYPWYLLDGRLPNHGSGFTQGLCPSCYVLGVIGLHERHNFLCAIRFFHNYGIRPCGLHRVHKTLLRLLNG